MAKFSDIIETGGYLKFWPINMGATSDDAETLDEISPCNEEIKIVRADKKFSQ